jgi:hypothetical protein
LDQRLLYIHNNPVVAGIVRYPEDYLFSSAGNYAGRPCARQGRALWTKIFAISFTKYIVIDTFV